MYLLHLGGCLLHLAANPYILVRLECGLGLRPYLVDVGVEVLIPWRARRLRHGAADRPETAVARLVAQERRFVRRADEDALAREFRCALAIGHAVDVRLLADELLDGFDVLVLHGRELADLDDPHAAQLLIRLLAPDAVQRIGEPLLAEFLEEVALADALRAFQHDHVVELQPWAHDAADACNQHLSCRRPRERCVLRAEAVDEQRVHALLAIPLQAAEILAHLMEHVPHGAVQHLVLDLLL